MTPIPLPTAKIYEGIEDKCISFDAFGWHSHLPFISEIVRRVKPKVIIEAGSWKGASAIRMIQLCAEQGIIAHIYCVDTWLGGADHTTKDLADTQGVMRDRHGWPGIYYQFLHNVQASGLADFITPIPMMTGHGAKLLKEHGIEADLIYIDAGHETLECLCDIESYWPLLKNGATIFGDDYERESVKDAV